MVGADIDAPAGRAIVWSPQQSGRRRPTTWPAWPGRALPRQINAARRPTSLQSRPACSLLGARESPDRHGELPYLSRAEMDLMGGRAQAARVHLKNQHDKGFYGYRRSLAPIARSAANTLLLSAVTHESPEGALTDGCRCNRSADSAH